MRVDPDALSSSLRRLAGRGTDASVLSALEATVRACVDLFDVTGSGLMIADELHMLRYVAASNEGGRILETAEAEHGQGPCTDAYVNNQPTSTADITADGRYTKVAPVVAPLGVRAVLGVPVRLGGVPLGSLDVYVDEAHDWDESERRALVTYSDVIEATLSAALAAAQAGELAAQLQYALDHRIIIERAVGFLMARDGVDPVIAFNRLRSSARGTRRKIGDIAEELLATSNLPS